MMQASVRQPRSRDMLREMLASANSRQLSAVAFAIGVPVATLKSYAIGSTSLDAATVQRVADFLLKGAYMVKMQGGERGGATVPLWFERAHRRGARR
jgi:hypothetical protein